MVERVLARLAANAIRTEKPLGHETVSFLANSRALPAASRFVT
jgi:hypothetical protein